MIPSQIVLLVLIGCFALYVFRLRTAARDRITYLALAAGGTVLILDPQLTNRIAAHVGIGRGADLMFYFFIMFCLFHFATTGATIRRLQREVTVLTQHQALVDARPPAMDGPAR